MIKICAPLKSSKEADDLIDCGASEIYCGVSESIPGYDSGESFSSREWCNMSSFLELQKVVDIAHSRNVEVSFTVNAFYSGHRYKAALLHAEKAAKTGVDSFILTDIGFLLLLKKQDFFGRKINIGSFAAVFNSSTVDFYKSLGASRIILPPHLNSFEIKDIIMHSQEIDFETFVFNGRCPNIAGLCRFVHGVTNIVASSGIPAYLRKQLFHLYQRFSVQRKLLVKLEKNLNIENFACFIPYSLKHIKGEKEFIYRNKCSLGNIFNYLDACAACHMFRFYKNGVKFFKVSGRHLHKFEKVRNVSFIKELAKSLRNVDSEQEFIELTKENKQRFFGSKNCSGMNCYY